MTTTTASTTTASTTCLIEENVNYDGNLKTHNGETQKQNDAMSCQSFCGLNYPDATHFRWVSPSHTDTWDHKTCYCMTSKTNQHSNSGKFSGEVCLTPSTTSATSAVAGRCTNIGDVWTCPDGRYSNI